MRRSPLLPLLRDSVSPTISLHHNRITCKVKQTKTKTDFSKESRSLYSLMCNLASIDTLPGFTLTHLMLLKCILLFQVFKPFQLLFLLPRRVLSLLSYPENSYLHFKILSNVFRGTVSAAILSILCVARTFCACVLLPSLR